MWSALTSGSVRIQLNNRIPVDISESRRIDWCGENILLVS